MRLLVSEFGSFVGKKGRRVVVKRGDYREEFPLSKISQILIECRGVCISCDLIKEVSSLGINVSFLFSDAPVAMLTYPKEGGKAAVRRKQVEHYSTERGTELVVAIIKAKLVNQMRVLSSLAKTGQLEDVSYARKLLSEMICALEAVKGPISECRNEIMAVEARFATEYWRNVACVVGKDVEIEGRVKRGATDPFNASLNYAYAILFSKVFDSAVKASLDPYMGFLHADAEGRCSLVFDVMEQFRPFVDRQVISLFTLNEFKVDEDFDKTSHLLTYSGRRRVVQAVFSLLDAYKPYQGKKMRFENIIRFECNLIADFLLGCKAYYNGYTGD
ncbi:MAG: CRISPR-associated endonuclease Cas1 [Candidatus Micrarchaeia archaeon]